MTGYNWTPIGQCLNGNYPFGGVFDGCGYTISNLSFNNTATDGTGGNVGLFGRVEAINDLSYVIIKNVRLDNVSFTGDYFVGGICGYAVTCNISNCAVSGTISGSRGIGGGGGLVCGSQ
jgi:hypothetical protein